eukprot:CAMPEP_0174350698 /NCGR_PEP_ID=MMETSP0811_2-20130205/7841_1 /TAXON_ID=73025 ORGANISM="Eutreptiella gymnastica-like, Strain CCMP1594" /NCGR_SAMPLE_ID=MMETSP0811_2 /ASSEMBLY_ACC=CAM_ASM_000667 /LENGTH=50 /DNA_ID=CAMNT_0015479243 /DNA_START=481 /DNA_END=633 /DNA_ORIENTATION=+
MTHIQQGIEHINNNSSTNGDAVTTSSCQQPPTFTTCLTLSATPDLSSAAH